MNTIEFETVYKAYVTDDKYAKKRNAIGYFSTVAGAQMAAKGQGRWGRALLVEAKSAVRINGELYVLETDFPVDLDNSAKEKTQNLIRSALQKLTAEERQALGLDDPN